MTMRAHSDSSFTSTLTDSPQAVKTALVCEESGSMATTIFMTGHFEASFNSEGMCPGVAKMIESSEWLMLA